MAAEHISNTVSVQAADSERMDSEQEHTTPKTGKIHARTNAGTPTAHPKHMHTYRYKRTS